MRYALAALTVLVQLAGCAGVGVVASSDPATKLSDASHLLTQQDRPLLAELLIREAMASYQSTGDAQGLGHAYRQYAEFLESPQVASEPYYRQKRFQDPTVTYDNRLVKSADYYSKAIAQYQMAEEPYRAASRFDQLTNVYYNMGLSYERLNDAVHACGFYEKALGAYKNNIQSNPSAKPRGNVEGTLAAAKQKPRCT
jgi:tetratricopeptide (TPR) repeat protein